MKQLDPKATWLFFASFFIRALMFFPIIAIWIVVAVSGARGNEVNIFPDNFLYWILLLVAILAVVTFIWAKLSFSYYKYDLTDLGFRKESGVIYKKYVTIPYNRIQNVDINRGILARLLGLSDLQIQTAGSSAVVYRNGISGAGSEGRLLGVSVGDAEILRDELIRRSSRSSGQGL